MFGLFKKKDETILKLLETINRCKVGVPDELQIVSNPLFDTLSGSVKHRWKKRDIANYKSMIQLGESPEAFIYNFIVHRCADRLESGSYHVYRGVLSGIGQLYLRLFEHAISIMVAKGEYTQQWADDNLRYPVQKEIKEVG